MTRKEMILDCLADGGEAESQIIDFFEFEGNKIDIQDIKNLIKEMLDENLIFIDDKWVNEFGENPYVMTTKGKEVWKKIK